jgi:hypothetical protein
MKYWGFIVALVALAVAWYVTQKKSKETFVPEFLEQSGVRRTAETASSSYKQETNHVIPTHALPEPIEGTETPFRVNMFNSYMV